MIEIVGLNVRYPGSSQSALANIDWSVEAGEFAVVAGESGGGKSTLLKCLNGLVPHLSGGEFGGSVLVDGHDTRYYGPRTLSRVTGFVFQEPESQAVTATVEDEIAFSMEQLGVAPLIMRKRVEEMLDLLGVAALRHRAVTTLSGGERQRVAIAAAMALQPKLLVLDEPTSQLDPWGANDMIVALERLNADLNVTIVIAEHRLDRLMPAADTLTWIEDGGIAFAGHWNQVAGRLPDHSAPALVNLARWHGMNPLPRTVKEFKRALNGRRPDSGGEPIAASAGDRVISAANVTVRIDGKSLLSNLDFTAHAGQITVLMGRNGSGKTTLLRTLFGFIKPARGSVAVAGFDMARTRPAELGKVAAYLPQRSGSVLFNESVRAEIAFTAHHRGCDSDGAGLADAFGVGELLDRDPRDLSEGQRLRAALVAVLVGEPRVVLLDEPTRGLDGRQKQHLVSVLRTLRDRGACVVLSTHDVELAANLADRVVLLGHGELIAEGTPHEVLSGSLAFSTQVNRLFGPGYLTVADLDLQPLREVGDTTHTLVR